MRKTLLKSFLVLLVLPMISGCVATKDQLSSLNLKVRNQDNRLVELEQLTSDGTNATGTVQKQLADLALELESISTELLQVKGQLDETNHRNRTLIEENQELRTLLDTRLQELDENSQNLQQKLVGLDSNLSTVQGQMEEDARRRAEQALQAAEKARLQAAAAAEAKRQAEEAQRRINAAAAAKLAAAQAAKNNSGIPELAPRVVKKKRTGAASAAVATTPAVSKQTTTTATTTPTTGKNEAESTYDTGLGQYRSNDYKGAITTFSTFLDKFPKDKLAPNARYWLGSSMLQSSDYSGAVLEFQNIVDGYPNHPKAPEALLQQAKAFEHFGEKAVQIKLYKDVLAYYPDSDQAKKAKKMLNKLQ